MELDLRTGRAASRARLGRNLQPAQSQAPGDKAETAVPEEPSQRPQEDRLELSEEAKALLQGQEEPASPAEKRMQAKKEKLQAAKQMLSVLQQQSIQMREQNDQQAKALQKALDQMKKCMKIAANIGKGHKVPPQDEQYLLEHDPKAYMMAMVMRMMEEEKEKVKSELKREDLENQDQSQSVDSASGAGEDLCIESGGDVPVE